MSSTSTSVATEALRTPRQRQGTACEDCRRRKLRCDGKEPQCGACIDAGIQCTATVSTNPRGPRKGHMKALQNRLASLERKMSAQDGTDTIPTAPISDPLKLPPLVSPVKNTHNNLYSPPIQPILTNSNLDTDSFNFSLDSGMDTSVFADPVDLPLNFFFSDMLRVDLDQIYFERAHPFAPILHRQRYFSWARNVEKTAVQQCLQYAMWTVAASLSTQMQHMHTFFYDSTCKMLDDFEGKETSEGFGGIEHIQARVLLPIYDFMRTNDQRGWLSAGRCFRLLQLQRMYEIDGPEHLSSKSPSPDVEAWSYTEEKRRTFWMAYCLDRFISIRNETPLTLNESVIATRLPAPEEDFQHDQWVEMGFLSEAITSTDNIQFSSFTESVILATFFGRAVAHKQQASVEHVYLNVPQHFWDRHAWLDKMLSTRIDILQVANQSTPGRADCMLLFTKMVAQTTKIYLCQVIEAMCWETNEYQDTTAKYMHRAWVSSKEISKLSGSLTQLSSFKAHPFTPLLLTMTADFLQSHRHLDPSIDGQLQGILDVLTDMAGINNLAADFLSKR